jgi:2-polyprenyl-3-methyl-5-hydroxy-6-metoxy-1,4-benzoquinol methylase
VPEDVRERCYAELARLHRRIGTTGAIVRRLRRDPLPVRSVLDIGCGHGALLRELQRRLEVQTVGVDLMPPTRQMPFPILSMDAVREQLPRADVAVCLAMVHHLSSGELAALIRNVGRSCRRFLIVDLVRHWLPFTLFRIFVAPFSHRINAGDGIRSFERAFTPRELKQVVQEALAGTPATFRHDVAPFYLRQIVDIRY